MGITLWFSMLTDSLEKVNKITEKWRTEYSKELDYYGIKHWIAQPLNIRGKINLINTYLASKILLGGFNG